MATTERMSLGHLFLTIFLVGLLFYLVNILPQRGANSDNPAIRYSAQERLGRHY